MPAVEHRVARTYLERAECPVQIGVHEADGGRERPNPEHDFGEMPAINR